MNPKLVITLLSETYIAVNGIMHMPTHSKFCHSIIQSFDLGRIVVSSEKIIHHGL
jgi:hypothetical protein